MPSKYQIIVAMAADEAKSIVSNGEKYMAFLNTAANTYKYSFQDQVLIHAQKPNAIACADMALAGIAGAIPCDEVIDAMAAVGHALPASLRETGEGGLAATPTGRKIAEQM